MEEDFVISVDESDEVHDFRFLKQKELPKNGDKDFEPDGSDVQTAHTRQALDLMYGVLAHQIKAHVRLVVHGVWLREHQCTVVVQLKGNYFRDLGVSSLFRDKQVVWLNKIESLYLLERGSMVVYASNDKFDQYLMGAINSFSYNDMHIMSLESFYSVMTSFEIMKYQVFAYLKRLGYLIRDYEMLIPPEPPKQRWSFSLFSPALPDYKKHHFFSYSDVLAPLNFIPSYKTLDSLQKDTASAFCIHYNVWKPRASFSKKRLPKPDFHVCVADSFPSLDDIHHLFNQVNFNGLCLKNLPYERLKDFRLKYGTGRSVIVAIIDSGVISFINLAETDFQLRLPELDQLKKRRHGIVVD